MKYQTENADTQHHYLRCNNTVNVEYHGITLKKQLQDKIKINYIVKL